MNEIQSSSKTIPHIHTYLPLQYSGGESRLKRRNDNQSSPWRLTLFCVAFSRAQIARRPQEFVLTVHDYRKCEPILSMIRMPSIFKLLINILS